MRGFACTVVVLACTLAGRNACAQDTPRVGLALAYPASVGVLWRVTDRIGVRPQLDVEFGAFESRAVRPLSTAADSDFWQVAGGVSALFYVHRQDKLSLYVSPRYSRYQAKNTSPGGIAGGLCVGSLETLECPALRRHGHGVAESFGVQYLASRRVGAFAELGLAHEWQTTPRRTTGRVISSGSKTADTRLRSGVGLLVLF